MCRRSCLRLHVRRAVSEGLLSSTTMSVSAAEACRNAIAAAAAARIVTVLMAAAANQLIPPANMACCRMPVPAKAHARHGSVLSSKQPCNYALQNPYSKQCTLWYMACTYLATR
jgi:hypothetical protein